MFLHFCPGQRLEPKTGPSCMWIHGWITVWVSQGTSYSKTYVELTRCQTPFSVIFVGYHTEVLQQPMLCCSVLSRLVPSNTLRPQGRLPGSSVHGGSLGKNIGMGCYFLLQSNNINQCKAKEKKSLYVHFIHEKVHQISVAMFTFGQIQSGTLPVFLCV